MVRVAHSYRPRAGRPGALLRLLLVGLCAAVALPRAAEAAGPVDREAAFHRAVEALAEGDHREAATQGWSYLQGASADDPRYDRALRLMARSAESLGLRSAAALWYLDIARANREPELVPDAVRGLERLIMGGPHDAETLVKGFLASAEIASLPDDVEPFVHWLQGLDSAQHGLDEWADRRFASIPEASPYRLRARYVQAVRRVARGDLPGAAADFEALLDAPKLPPDVRTDTLRSLARLAFEDGRYDDALGAYTKIRDHAAADPALLLEMAWTHFHLGQARRALGLLVGLDAPAYHSLIAPERFLLEALALRRLCQFDAARLAAVRLGSRHGDALQAIRAGVLPRRSEPLRAAARGRGEAKRLAALRASIEAELAWVGDHRRKLGKALTAELQTLLGRAKDNATRREEVALARETAVLAEELLRADEGVRLIQHELSVALLRGRRRPPGPREERLERARLSGEEARFRFTGEFWTDEIDDLVVTLDDRCIE